MAKSLGISLSGGGVRGIAHIGVLQALEENDLQPAQLTGASAGALVGALYAAGMMPPDILKVFKESSVAKLFKVGLPMRGLSDNSYIMDVLREHIPEDDFSTLKRRLHVSVTNLTTGQYEIKSEGKLFQVIAASAAIPILFHGQEIDGELYFDGGVLNNLPIEPLLGRCYPIIGVNVSPIQPRSDLDGMLTVGYRTFDLVMWGNVVNRLKQCDVVLQPDADDFNLFDLSAADQIYQLGYDSAMAKMDDILAMARDNGQLKPAPSEPEPEPEPVQESAEAAQSGGFWVRIKSWFGN
jgi:NTE family protein